MKPLLPLLALVLAACGGGGTDDVTARLEVLSGRTMEGGPALRFRVLRSGERREALAVGLHVSGSASNLPGADFAEAPLPTLLVIPAGARSVEIALTAIEDGIAEPDEALVVRLREARGRYRVGGAAEATLVVAGQDAVLAVVTPDEAEDLIAAHAGDPAFAILDVRTPAEFALGHIAGAVNLDFLATDFATHLAAMPRDAVYLLHCKSGARSTQALAVMLTQGFAFIYHMPGGFDAWGAGGHPVSPG
jgi:rhodanese-related sulfurtransferase